MNGYKRGPGAVYTSLFGSMPFLFRSRRRHSTGAASWLIPIRRAVTFLQSGRQRRFPLWRRHRKNRKEDFSPVCLWSVCLSAVSQTDGGIMSLHQRSRLDSSDGDRKHPHHLAGNTAPIFVHPAGVRLSKEKHVMKIKPPADTLNVEWLKASHSDQLIH